MRKLYIRGERGWVKVLGYDPQEEALVVDFCRGDEGVGSVGGIEDGADFGEHGKGLGNWD